MLIEKSIEITLSRFPQIMNFTIEICRSAIDFRPRVDWMSFAAIAFEQMHSD